MELKITEENAGRRLDVFLTGYLSKFSRNSIQNLVKSKNILINGKNVKSNYKLKEEDIISIKLPKKKVVKLESQKIPLDIVYEDSDILVINKSAGIVVHPSFGHKDKTLVNAILAHCQDLSFDKIKEEVRPGIVHRLDKDTSGLLVVAKNSKSMMNLTEQLKKREAIKKYLLLVKGKLKPKEGAIELPLKRSLKDRKKITVRSDGKYAKTEYVVKKYYKEYSLIEAKLITGRTHQLRVHFSHIRYPIVGDKTYGWRNTKAIRLDRQFLHAYYLKFKHPVSNEVLEFKINLPEELENIIKKLEK